MGQKEEQLLKGVSSKEKGSSANAAKPTGGSGKGSDDSFQLSGYYKKRLAAIALEGELKAERFATKFRFGFYGLLVLFSVMSFVGGRPAREFISLLTAVSLCVIYNTVAYFVLRRTDRYLNLMKYASTFIEITVLSFIIGFLTYSQKNPTMPYTGAIVLIYFVLLALSSIRNDRNVILFALGLVLLQFGTISFYFYGDVAALNAKLAEYTAVLVPALAEEQGKFKIVSISQVSLVLKLMYFAATGLLVVYALSNSRITANRQSNLIFSTEKEHILKEKEKSDYLLLNILPEEVAAELKEAGHAAPRKYDAISVLFTDFKGFTHIAEKLTPEELVHELDVSFRKFDEIIEKYDLEKIKTIGDAYMCAGGLPRGTRTHAIDCTLAGLEIQNFMNEQKAKKHAEGRPYWELRLGIHTGTVVAGVVGKKKFAYDIWGDTVNVASRMESSGTPGHVNISEAIYQEVKDFFVCQFRGEIEAKNKGRVKMYFVHGIRPNLSVDEQGAEPNNLFWQKLGLLKGRPTYRAS